MTTQNKNIAIAEMLGWEKLTKEQEESWTNCNGDRIEKLKIKNLVPILRSISCNEYMFGDDIRFHSDANWQFEAMDWVEDKGYQFWIGKYASSITKEKDSEFSINIKLPKREAIFEALYQFSQYLKTQR